MQINASDKSVSYVTRQHIADIHEQKQFEAFRIENPTPLSEGAKQLAEYRGLKDVESQGSTQQVPVTTKTTEGIDAYA
jgi:hypothetical protein